MGSACIYVGYKIWEIADNSSDRLRRPQLHRLNTLYNRQDRQ